MWAPCPATPPPSASAPCTTSWPSRRTQHPAASSSCGCAGACGLAGACRLCMGWCRHCRHGSSGLLALCVLLLACPARWPAGLLACWRSFLPVSLPDRLPASRPRRQLTEEDKDELLVDPVRGGGGRAMPHPARARVCCIRLHVGVLHQRVLGCNASRMWCCVLRTQPWCGVCAQVHCYPAPFPKHLVQPQPQGARCTALQPIALCLSHWHLSTAPPGHLHRQLHPAPACPVA